MEQLLTELLAEYLQNEFDSSEIDTVFWRYDNCVQKIINDSPVEDKMKLYEAFNLGLFKYLKES